MFPFRHAGSRRVGWNKIQLALRSVQRLPSDVLTRYLRLNARYPLTTAVGTSAALWITGDTVAQTIEARGEAKPLDMRRLIATTAEGSLVNGGIGCLWYRMLDTVTTKRLTILSNKITFVFRLSVS
jgi:hypothetical protein